MKWGSLTMSLIVTGHLSAAPFDKEAIRDHIRTLASDELQGRAPMTLGEDRTIQFVTKQFEKNGLSKIPGWNSFLQDVPLIQIKTSVLDKPKLGSRLLETGTDITITSAAQVDLNIADVEVIFVGYGISSQDWEWDDYKDIDVKDKIVVMLVNDPGFARSDLFHGKEMTYFGRWTYKLEEAARRGALGAFVIHETDAAGYGFQVISHKMSYLGLDSSQNKGLQVQGWLSRDATVKIFADAGQNFEALKMSALRPGGATTRLGSFSLTAKNTVSRNVSRNVCGMVKGKSKPDEYVLLSAHWDHLGMKSREDGTTEIYRGAIDNGTGLAAVLELSRVLAKQESKPDRSLLFCSFTAEEQGLLGVKHFIDNPPISLEAIQGVLNFDCLNVGKKNESVLLYGGNQGQLDQVLSQEVKKQGRKVVSDPNSEKGYFYRSDHYPFVQKNVKSLLFMDIGFSEPDYLQRRYHQPSDAFDSNWTLDGMLQDLELFKAITLRIGSACLS